MLKSILLLGTLFILASCNTSQDAIKEATTTAVDPKATTSIAPENDMCICTKEYRPVCGSNGQTYPNPCQAGCDKIKEFTEGPCK